MDAKDINIKNRRAKFDYEIIETFTAVWYLPVRKLNPYAKARRVLLIRSVMSPTARFG